jgi:hypothetical protein
VTAALRNMVAAAKEVRAGGWLSRGR